MIPTLFPLYDYSTSRLHGGSVMDLCAYCNKVDLKEKCRAYYESLPEKPPGFYHCPSGFTTRTFYCLGRLYAVTGVIAFPRFNTGNERQMVKKYQSQKTSRAIIEQYVDFIKESESHRADAIQSSSAVLPQAFHELRKLNGSIIQHAEKELKKHDSPALVTIHSAAELMRNNFDMLEGLSNIDSIKALPLDTTICLMDLAYKMKKVYETRAQAKRMTVNVNGPRAIIPGSKKSFPTVPAVLIENAIKYGVPGSDVAVKITVLGERAFLTVENQTNHSLDVEHCFDRGSRFAKDAAEGGGFGLFLAKEIVHSHNGSIKAEICDGVVRMSVEVPLEKVIAKNWK